MREAMTVKGILNQIINAFMFPVVLSKESLPMNAAINAIKGDKYGIPNQMKKKGHPNALKLEDGKNR